MHEQKKKQKNKEHYEKIKGVAKRQTEKTGRPFAFIKVISRIHRIMIMQSILEVFFFFSLTIIRIEFKKNRTKQKKKHIFTAIFSLIWFTDTLCITLELIAHGQTRNLHNHKIMLRSVIIMIIYLWYQLFLKTDVRAHICTQKKLSWMCSLFQINEPNLNHIPAVYISTPPFFTLKIFSMKVKWILTCTESTDWMHLTTANTSLWFT